MIKEFKNGKLNNCDSLIKTLGLHEIEKPVVAFIGGGGKTTTMKRLVKEYNKKGVPVIVTTTTHLFNENEPWFLLEPSMEKALDIIEKYKVVWIGSLTDKGKMAMPDKEFLDKMINLGYPVLIEADGARRLPCKAPGENEPVYISQVNSVVNVYGIDSIGKKIEETCFRPENVAGILGKDLKDIVTEEDVVVLATDKRAGKKDIDINMDYHVIINKVDNDVQVNQAGKICTYSDKRGLCDIIITGNRK